MLRILSLGFIAALAMAAQQSPQPSIKHVRSISLNGVSGRIDHMAIDRETKRLFVGALENGSVEILDLAASKHTGRIDGMKEPQGIAYIASTKQVIVACGGDGTCRAFDATSLSEVARVDAGADADNIRVDETRGLVYVGFEPGLALLELSGLKKRGSIELAGHAESFQLEPKGSRIFVNVPDSRQVQAVDRDSRTIVANWQIKEAKKNYPMALDADGHRLFVICRDPSRLFMIDTESGKSVTSVECVGDADDVFFDARHQCLYISGGEGFIDVFNIDSSSQLGRIERVATARGARTCLFDADTGSLYLAVPRRGDQAAEIREFKVVPPE